MTTTWTEAELAQAHLEQALGRLTGVVVRLASAEVGLLDDEPALEDLERQTADRLTGTLVRLGREGLSRYETKGRALLQSAFASYVRERAGKDAPLLEGVSRSRSRAVKPLPLKVLYAANELADAIGVS